jgi:hypothetical protein
MTDYHNDLNNEIYSWTTCDFYVFDYNRVDCSVTNIKYSSCSDYSGTIGSSLVILSNGFTSASNDCKWALSSINLEKPWYTSGCRND